LARLSRAGYCFRCDRWLGSNEQAKISRVDQSEEELKEQIEQARIVDEILVLSAELPSSLSLRNFIEILKHYVRSVAAGN
jgi:hypothetical protein